eukprot:6476273-Amphidinium_carterae.1
MAALAAALSTSEFTHHNIHSPPTTGRVCHQSIQVISPALAEYVPTPEVEATAAAKAAMSRVRTVVCFLAR